MSEWEISDEALGVVAEKAAQLTLNGVGINQQVKDLADEFKVPMTRTKALALKKHPKYVETLMKAAEAGKLQLKAGISGLVPDLISCIGSALKEGGTLGVRAAAIASSVLTGKDDQDNPQQAQQINITLATDEQSVTTALKKSH